MARRRSLKGVLAGFLGTYTSRYSDHRGYWLFGQLPDAELENSSIDLLSIGSSGSLSSDAAHRLAVTKFADQVAKAGLPMEVIESACLSIEATGEPVRCWQGDHRSVGRRVIFTARVQTDTGTLFEVTRDTVVAPHDPNKERRRHESDWGT